MVVGPWVMMNAIVNLFIGIAGTFRAKFPDCPVFAMLVVEEFDKCICRIPVGTLGIG